jgi:hypothetical protein
MKTPAFVPTVVLLVITAHGSILGADGKGTGITVENRFVVHRSKKPVAREGAYEKTECYPSIHRMANGNLMATYSTSPDEVNPDVKDAFHRLLSVDNGRSWRDLGAFDIGGVCRINLRDGTFLELWFNTVRAGDKWVTKVIRSKDYGLTYTIEENVPVNVENVKEGVKRTGMFFDGGLVEMDNGELLATMYGYFQGDSRYRCVLVRSRDKGQSWHYVSTIAHATVAGGGEYCEPAMIRIGSAGLLAIMRNDHEATQSTLGLFQTRSTDAGLTWSKPIVVADRGVKPAMVQTDDGILVCSYGRPNVYVMYSPDGEGREWTGNRLIYQGSGTCYTGMVKMGPNKILLIHDACGHREPGDNQAYNYVFAVLLSVQRR